MRVTPSGVVRVRVFSSSSMIMVPKIFWNMLKIADIVLITAVVAFASGLYGF